MKFEKPALSFEQQADRLLERGIQGDRNTIIRRLQSVSYYRLSGYAYPFRIPQDPTSPPQDEVYLPDTQFETIWRRYVFDRQLRLLVMDAIERIEVSVRTQLAYNHAHEYGPFGYALNPWSLPKFAAADSQAVTGKYRDLTHAEFLAKVRLEVGRSRERFVKHFHQKYGDEHTYLPIWMAAEVMSFGNTLAMFKGCPNKVKNQVADAFGMPDEVFKTWLLALNTVRNICAHHGRLWNRGMGTKPTLPLAKDYPEWHSPVAITNERIFVILTICRYCLKHIAPQSKWDLRIKGLLREYPDIPLKEMGFPEGWESSPVWI